MDSDSDSQENNGAEENGRCGNLNNEKKEDKKGSTLFGMTLVNSYGSAVLAKLKDDGNPIKFTSRCSFIAKCGEEFQLLPSAPPSSFHFKCFFFL